jgi:cell division protein FtsL
MSRVCLMFAFLLMLSALSLVTARYQSRLLFVSSERMTAKTQELDVEWRRLQLERAELARNARVDQLARKELKMVVPTPVQTVYMKNGQIVSGPAAIMQGGEE